MNVIAKATALTLVMLATSVSAQEPSTVTGVVTTRADGLSLPGATVSIPALGLSAMTDQEGRFPIAVPQGQARGQTVDLRIEFPGLEADTVQVRLSEGTVTQDFQMGLAFAESVTVGSRAPGAEAERAVPVDVLTSDEIQSTGYPPFGFNGRYFYGKITHTF